MLTSQFENDPQSLRGFLGMVARDYPDELLRIAEPVAARLDMTAVTFELERVGKSPVVIFDNVEGHSMPVVANIAANRRLLAACLGVNPGDLPAAFRERCQRPIACERVDTARWNDIVLEGDA